MIRFTTILFLFFSVGAQAQYYYKDLITSLQTMERTAGYKTQKVRNVNVISIENTGERTEDFSGTQTISSDFKKVVTSFNTPMSGASELTTFFDDKGRIVKSIDTADGSYSESQYFYNDRNLLEKMANVSTSAGNKTETEDHLWTYTNSGQPEKMLRIKNGGDTTVVNFVLDEQGNVAEENSTRRGTALPSFYYYYDNKNRLTDIVSYNVKAKRLLPLYIFEYTNGDQLASMLVVPEGTDDYQKWMYEYNGSGLKIKETCLNKKKQVLGRIEYAYR